MLHRFRSQKHVDQKFPQHCYCISTCIWKAFPRPRHWLSGSNWYVSRTLSILCRNVTVFSARWILQLDKPWRELVQNSHKTMGEQMAFCAMLVFSFNEIKHRRTRGSRQNHEHLFWIHATISLGCKTPYCSHVAFRAHSFWLMSASVLQNWLFNTHVRKGMDGDALFYYSGVAMSDKTRERNTSTNKTKLYF